MFESDVHCTSRTPVPILISLVLCITCVVLCCVVLCVVCCVAEQIMMDYCDVGSIRDMMETCNKTLMEEQVCCVVFVCVCVVCVMMWL